MKNYISTLITALALAMTSIDASAKGQTDANNTMTDYSTLENVMTSFIGDEMRKKDIPGLAIAIVDDQRIIWSDAFGYADRENKRRVNIDTQFRAGSITKIFTAIAIMQLVEQGKLDLDNPLKTYLPQFKINSRYGNTDDITVRNVLSHTAGLPSEYIAGMWQEIVSENHTAYTELVDLIQYESTSYPPYTASSYSNVGLTLLGHVVHNVSGNNYQDYVRQNILGPLNMSRSDIEQTISGGNIALSYREKSHAPILELALRDIPAGGLNSGVEDLAHLIMMVNASGKFADQQVLQVSTLNSMFIKPTMLQEDTPAIHGLGWIVDNSGLVLGEGQTIVGHDGATLGHTSQLKVAPKVKLGVVVMGNTGGSGIYDIADFALKQAYAIKTGKSPVEPKINYNNCEITENDDIGGAYVFPDLGLATIEKIRGKWIVDAFGVRMKLKQQQNGLTRFSYKWLGIFPADLGELDDIALCFKLHGHRVDLSVYYDGRPTGIAQKVTPVAISDLWKKRLGRYKLVGANAFLDIAGSSTNVKLSLENELIVMQTGESPIKSVLLPIDDQQAVIAGFGRSLGETIRVRINTGREELLSSGLILTAIE